MEFELTLSLIRRLIRGLIRELLFHFQFWKFLLFQMKLESWRVSETLMVHFFLFQINFKGKISDNLRPKWNWKNKWKNKFQILSVSGWIFDSSYFFWKNKFFETSSNFPVLFWNPFILEDSDDIYYWVSPRFEKIAYY